MAIRWNSEFQHGDNVDDLDEWIREYQPGGFRVDRVGPSICRDCGKGEFRVVVDDGGSGAYRVCVGCAAVAYIADSDVWWMDEESEPITCRCGGTVFEVVVSFAFYADHEVRLVGVGVRCVADGMLGSPAEWNNRRFPSLHLLDRV